MRSPSHGNLGAIMDVWVKLKDGAYTNLRYVISVYADWDVSAETWRVGFVGLPSADATVHFDGSYASEALAASAARELVNGVTLAGLVG